MSEAFEIFSFISDLNSSQFTTRVISGHSTFKVKTLEKEKTPFEQWTVEIRWFLLNIFVLFYPLPSIHSILQHVLLFLLISWHRLLAIFTKKTKNSSTWTKAPVNWICLWSVWTSFRVISNVQVCASRPCHLFSAVFTDEETVLILISRQTHTHTVAQVNTVMCQCTSV